MRQQGTHFTDKGDEPLSAANTSGMLGSSEQWIERIATTVSTDTPLAKILEPDNLDVPKDQTTSSSLTSVSPSSIFSSVKEATDSLTSRSASQNNGQGEAEARAQRSSNSSKTEPKEQGSSSGTFRLPATLGGSSINPSSFSFIKTALPLFKNMTQSERKPSGSSPNPLASSLARD